MPTGLHHRKMEFTVGGKRGESAGGLQSTVGNNRRVTGRAAFFDLAAETRWGGFISGDEITVNWEDECPCGRKSQFIEGTIERYSDKRGGDDKISCAATENAHKEAMDFLTSFE